MKKIIFLTLSIFFTFETYAYNLVGECNGCNESQSRQKAITLANSIINGGFVYLYDFSNHKLRKYFTWKEDIYTTFDTQDNSATDKPKLKDPVKEAYKYLKSIGIKNKDILDIFDSGDYGLTTSSTYTFAIEVNPSQDEIDNFSIVDDLFDTFVNAASSSGTFPPYLINPGTGGPIGNDFGAYDIIGNRSLTISLFNQISNDSFSQHVISVLEAIEWITSSLGALNLNFELNIVITFPDGSKGIMHFDQYGDLVFDDSSFIDVDGNPLPFTASDSYGRTYQFNIGGVGGYDNMMGRLWLLGLTSGSGRVCSGHCDANGCTTTCTRG